MWPSGWGDELPDSLGPYSSSEESDYVYGVGGVANDGFKMDPWRGGYEASTAGNSQGDPVVGNRLGGSEAAFANTNGQTGMTARVKNSFVFYTQTSNLYIGTQNYAFDIPVDIVPTPRKDANLNVTPGGIGNKQRPSRIKDAITVKQNTFSVAGREAIRTKNGVNIYRPKSQRTRSRIKEEVDPKSYTSVGRTVPLIQGDQRKVRGAEGRSNTQSASVGYRRARLREQNPIVKARSAGAISKFKDTQDFKANYEMKMVAAPVNNSRVFVDVRCNIVPRVDKLLQLSVYALQNGRSKLIGETVLETASNPRIVSTTATLKGFVPGQNVTVMAQLTDGTNTLGTMTENFVLEDSGSTKQAGSVVPKGKAVKPQAIDTLVNSKEKVKLIIGKNGKMNVLCHVYHDYTKSGEQVEIGAYTTTNRVMQEHSITIHNAEASTGITGEGITGFNGIKGSLFGFSEPPLAKNVGQISIPGLKINDQKYAGAVWTTTSYTGINGISADGTGHLWFTVSNVGENVPSKGMFYAGANLSIQDTEITNSHIFTGTGALYNININTPYPDTKMLVYQAGGNNIVPSDVTTQEFTTNYEGSGTVSIQLALPTWLGIAVQGPFSLYERTIKWLDTSR